MWRSKRHGRRSSCAPVTSCSSPRSAAASRGARRFSAGSSPAYRAMKIAFLCPGQGSQAVGMGGAFADASKAAAAIWQEADEALGFSLSRLCREGPEGDLLLTANTQPAVLTATVAAGAVLAERGIVPDLAAGHSLGEYSALVLAGALSFRDAV